MRKAVRISHPSGSRARVKLRASLAEFPPQKTLCPNGVQNASNQMYGFAFRVPSLIKWAHRLGAGNRRRVLTHAHQSDTRVLNPTPYCWRRVRDPISSKAARRIKRRPLFEHVITASREFVRERFQGNELVAFGRAFAIKALRLR